MKNSSKVFAAGTLIMFVLLVAGQDKLALIGESNRTAVLLLVRIWQAYGGDSVENQTNQSMSFAHKFDGEAFGPIQAFKKIPTELMQTPADCPFSKNFRSVQLIQNPHLLNPADLSKHHLPNVEL